MNIIRNLVHSILEPEQKTGVGWLYPNNDGTFKLMFWGNDAWVEITDGYVTFEELMTILPQYVAGLYKVKGTISFDELPVVGMKVGDVYNIADAFITDGRFKEGAGLSYPAGTNVVWVSPDFDNESKWDVLAGNIDLSIYQTIEEATLETDSKEIPGAINELLEKIKDLNRSLYPLKAQISCSPSLVKKGNSVNVSTNWSTTVNNIEVIPDTQAINGIILPSTIKHGNNENVTDTTLYTYGATYDTMTVVATATVTFVYPVYWGLVLSDDVITAESIQGMSEVIKYKDAPYIASNRTFTNQEDVYAYPSYYGDLTSIKDQNNFEQLSGYTKTTILLTVGNNESIQYNVYRKNEPATNINMTLTYKV